MSGWKGATINASAHIHDLYHSLSDLCETWLAEADDRDWDAVGELLGWLNDTRNRLADMEAYLAREAGLTRAVPDSIATPYGVVEVARRNDRKEWRHDVWQYDVRAKVAASAEGLVVLDHETGEEVPAEGWLLERLAQVQQVHGSTNPRSTDLRALSLDPGDYCTTVRGAFTVRVKKPTEEAS